MDDRDGDLGARGAPDVGAHLVERHARSGDAVDRGDLVAGLDAGCGGRRSGDDLVDLEHPESLPSSTPIPATLAFREAWNAAYSVGVRKVEWPVSPRLSTMPLIEP